MKRNLLLGSLALAVAVGGCAAQSQMTSGVDYLARYPAGQAAPRHAAGQAEGASAAADRTPSLDELVRQAAAVEPNLRLPARIGLARLSQGRLVTIPEEEAMIWRKLAEKLGPSWGEFVGVSPLAAAFAFAAVDKEPRDRRSSGLEDAVDRVRIGAARQHIDIVLVYETDGSGQASSTPFAVGNLTILGGYLLPGEHVKAKARAAALLLDVRNGYPYGVATAGADGEGYAPSFTWRDRERELLRDAQLEAVANLAGNVEKLTFDLAAKALARKD